MKYLINIVSEQINPKVFKKQMPFDNNLINYKLNHFVPPPYNPWFYGYDYANKKLNLNFDKIRNLNLPIKDKVMSVIISQKNFIPDHQRRLDFINELKKRYRNQIDFSVTGEKI